MKILLIWHEIGKELELYEFEENDEELLSDMKKFTCSDIAFAAWLYDYIHEKNYKRINTYDLVNNNPKKYGLMICTGI